MTEEQIDNLTGRELDAAVAEHVFGFTVLRGRGIGPDGGPILAVKDGFRVEAYHRDIAAAWTVKKAIGEKGLHWLLMDWVTLAEEVRYKAAINARTGSDWTCVVAFALTTELAICRAALKAVMREKGKDR